MITAEVKTVERRRMEGLRKEVRAETSLLGKHSKHPDDIGRRTGRMSEEECQRQ